MMKKSSLLFATCLLLLLGACGRGQKKQAPVVENPGTDMEMVESSRKPAGAPKTAEELKADFMGTFSGVLPCADCSGILTTLTLNADYTYKLETVYQGKGDEKANIQQGKWTPSEDLAFVQLNYDKPSEVINYALIDKNTLEKLDADAKPIASQANHKLTRK